MSEPTKEQMLVEWLNDRLGLVYLGLTQLSESPGYWETYYEDEIEPLESIRALIESSGEKASGEGFGPCACCDNPGVRYCPDRGAWVCEEHAFTPAPSPATKRKENDNGQL